MPYRTSVVRMYYARVPGKDTEVPFAEFRTFVISKEPLLINPKLILDFQLEKLEWIFTSVMTSIIQAKIYWQIEGEEIDEKIDNDEALVNLASTGLTRGVKYDTPYRYVRFIKESRDIEYNERDIRIIEKERELEVQINPTKIKFTRYLEIKTDLGYITTSQLMKYKDLERKGF